MGTSNTVSSPCLLWCWYIFCWWRYIFYLSRDQGRPLCWDVMCIYGWELLAVCTTLKSLVTIDILIVKRKDASSKTFYKNVLRLKNWVDWITTRQKKNVTNTKMVYFEKKCPEIKKNHIFTLMTTFNNFTLKMETSWAKKVLKPIL